MIEYLEKWLYINDISNKNIIKIWKIIEKENKKPVIFTSQAEILYYFWLLVNKKIDLETFFLINEPWKTNYQYTYPVSTPFDGIYYVKHLPSSKKKNLIFIFDKKYTNLIHENKLENTYTI